MALYQDRRQKHTSKRMQGKIVLKLSSTSPDLKPIEIFGIRSNLALGIEVFPHNVPTQRKQSASGLHLQGCFSRLRIM